MNEERRNPNQPSRSDCEAAVSLVPAYCVGAADPEERAFVEAHIADCPEVAAEIKEYQRLAETLLFSAPPMQPPAHLADQLMAAINPPVPPPSVRRAAEPAPVRPPTPWEQIKNLVFPEGRFSPALAAAAIILLIVSNLGWAARVSDLNSQQQQIETRLDEQSKLIRALSAREANRVELASTQSGIQAYATMMWGPGETGKTWVVLLSAKNFPSLTPDKTYQLWLIRGDKPLSAGLFGVDSEGSGQLIFEANEPLGSFDAFGITLEPAGGSPTPTTPPLAVVQL